MSRKVILTCAVTGGAPFNRNHPAMPVTPPQIAAACLEAARAGASVVHTHVRDPQTGENSRRPDLFREVVDRVRGSGQDIVINLTCGHGAFFLPDPEDESRPLAGSDVVSAAERMRHLEECLPATPPAGSACWTTSPARRSTGSPQERSCSSAIARSWRARHWRDR